ncbi:hypothetical protein PAEPH01_1663 [Pancytospora epiphaga]|nr:hypothetical protein PAEPH01_1663 [Pancytospora epiphaga]
MDNKERLCIDFFNEISRIISNKITQYGSYSTEGETVSEDKHKESISLSDENVINESLNNMLKECNLKELKAIYDIVEYLKIYSIGIHFKPTCSMESYIRFLRTFSAKLGCNVNAKDGLIVMLSPGDKYTMLETTASRLFNVLFLMQRLSKISFYELSIISTFQRIHFKDDRCVKEAVTKMCKAYVYNVSREYASYRQYKISTQLLHEFSVRIESYINAFNGLVNELHINQSVIPKILFVLLVFRVDDELTFLKSYGEPELFYCSVRIFHSGSEFAKRLENFMKTQLFWEFRTDMKAYTLDHLFQAIYKYEYRKLIGGINKINEISSKYASKRIKTFVPHQQRPMMSINIIPSVPNMDESKSIKTFSPLSRKIAEAAGLRDNIASKRKLDFN